MKEIRQMVRGRDFNYSFGISLLAGFFVAFFGLGYALTSIGESGAWVFSALMVCLALLGLIVVPLGAFSALRSERVDQTLDLITQTTLTPRGIVIGKLMTQWVKLITLFAGLAPFIAMSFLLGGIDLLTILISLCVLFMWSMWVCSLCLFLSAASQARAMSALIFIGMIIGFIGIVGTFGPMIARSGLSRNVSCVVAGNGMVPCRFHCRVLYEHDQSRSACRESPVAGDRGSIDGFAYRLFRAVSSWSLRASPCLFLQALPDTRLQTWPMAWVSSAGFISRSLQPLR